MKVRILIIHFLIFLTLSLFYFFISDEVSKLLNPNYYNVEIAFRTFLKGEFLLLFIIIISCIVFLYKNKNK
ncbi:hypothetical protein TCRASSO_30456 [Tenacibaculum crassostreae]